MQETILSVGIDIGTSTTQLIFSRLTIENLASNYTVPRISIVNKEVIYRSGIHFTPLKSQTEIDAAQVKDIIRDEYRKADMRPEDLQTGAVIITGETARKQNANTVLESLSDMAGDFVVATAGPDLESVLSAKGAGTDKISEEKREVVANLDIGGGTSNIAFFQKGNLKGTCCLDIGGRLIKVEDGKISYIFPSIQELADRHQIRIRVGDRADENVLYRVCEYMAQQLAMALYIEEPDEFHGRLYTNQGKLNLFNQKYELDPRPIEEGCGCPACRSYSRAYIRHLLKAKEMLGMRLCTLHNLYFYNTMMKEIRDAIEEHRYKEYKAAKLAGMEDSSQAV